MASDTHVPLTAEELTNGREVKSGDNRLTIEGRVSGEAGASFLLVSDGKTPICGLIREGTVRDEFESVPADETAERRANAGQEKAPDPVADPASPPPPPDGQGTGGTPGTGS